ncbi:MAG: DUF2007 domain-containing protein [Bryobacterales bacterium]
MSDRLIVLQGYNNLQEAELVRALLESHGIAAFLTDQNIARLTRAVPFGGVRVHVGEDDLEEARGIVQEALENQEAAPEETVNEDGCPICGGQRSEPADDPVRSRLGVLLLGIPFLLLLAKRRCQGCGYVGRW